MKIINTIKFLLVVQLSFLNTCKQATEIELEKGLIANAGEDVNIPSASYVVFDLSNCHLGENPNLFKIRIEWKQDENNPEKVLLADGSYTPKIHVGFIKEGTYRFTLRLNNGTDTSNTDEKIVTVGQREKSFIEDAYLETKLRYKLRKQTGKLTDEDLQKIDSVAGYSLAFYDGTVKSIKGLELCRNLTYISLNLEDLSDLTPLRELTNIKYLSINQNYNLKDISPLSNLINLEYLDIESNDIDDINSLKALKKLKFFNIMYNHKISDINVLENFTEIEQLLISGHNINNIEPIRKLVHLQNLWALKCNLVDITPIANLIDIKYLYLRFNNINNIEPLKKLQKLTKLYLWENKIEDISVLEYLPTLQLIELRDNSIKDILPLVKNENIKDGTIVNIYENPLDDKSINEYIPALVNRGVVVFH